MQSLFNISRSISQSDLSHKSEPSNSVHIEIKNMSKSQDHLATANIGPGPIHQQSGRPLRSSSSSSRRSSIVSEGHQQMGHQASVSGACFVCLAVWKSVSRVLCALSLAPRAKLQPATACGCPRTRFTFRRVRSLSVSMCCHVR